MEKILLSENNQLDINKFDFIRCLKSFIAAHFNVCGTFVACKLTCHKCVEKMRDAKEHTKANHITISLCYWF